MGAVSHHQPGSEYAEMEVTGGEYPEDKANEHQPLF